MRGIVRSPFARGLAIVTVVSLVIVALSLEESLVTASALMSVAFFLALAFFAFLLWRERRAEIEQWGGLSRWTFYGAVGTAILAIALFVGLGANGRESLVLVGVLVACGYALFRVWRREHTYS
jgi:amino acid transporter